MMKIKIKLEEISLRIKRNYDGKNGANEIPIYFRFYFKQDEIFLRVGQKQKFTGEKQSLNIIHEIYVKTCEIVKKNIEYKVLLVINNQGKQNQTQKYIGQCDLQLGSYVDENDSFPLQLELLLPIRKCKDPEAVLKLTMEIREIQEFQKMLGRKQEIDISKKTDLNQSYLTQKQIKEDFSSQQLNECKSQLQRLNCRSVKYKNQISHLKEENHDLNQEITERKEGIKISSRLKQDKLDLLIKKNLKIEREFIQAKEKISDIVNMINEYGRLDIVEEISNILVD